MLTLMLCDDMSNNNKNNDDDDDDDDDVTNSEAGPLFLLFVWGCLTQYRTVILVDLVRKLWSHWLV